MGQSCLRKVGKFMKKTITVSFLAAVSYCSVANAFVGKCLYTTWDDRISGEDNLVSIECETRSGKIIKMSKAIDSGLKLNIPISSFEYFGISCPFLSVKRIEQRLVNKKDTHIRIGNVQIGAGLEVRAGLGLSRLSPCFLAGGSLGLGAKINYLDLKIHSLSDAW
jgi:hypothetical protein